MRTVGIGHQNFEKVRMRNIFYVDKTKLIKEWWESEDEVTLITRPRRFGKTLNMSMLENFFSVEYAGRAELFEGLAIWDEEIYRELQGTWPVLFASFAGVKETSFPKAKQSICRMIGELYRKYDFLLKGDLLTETERELYQNVSMYMDEVTATSSLQTLGGYLYRYYGKKVIILLDEYDTPMQEAYVHGYWEEIAEFIRTMFNVTFKTNPYLERAVMTGITRVSKESIFSDLNHLKVVTTTSDKYEDAFGFTEQEVFAALAEYGLSEQQQLVKSWYDGFTFGQVSDIYNPWSIINYLGEKKLGTYWANTSSNSLAGKLIREGSPDIKMKFEELLRGGVLEAVIDEQIVFSQLSAQKNAVWSLLLASGYLKTVEYRFDEPSGQGIYRLSLTNKEVRIMFENMIRDWFYDGGDSYSCFIRAFLMEDLDAMNEYMNRVAMSTFRYFDTGKQPSGEEPERFYHGFVLGLMVELAGRYTILSNRESGFGRYDVMLEPLRAEDDAYILEFKVYSPRRESSLEGTVENALLQIEKKPYEAALKAKGIEDGRIRKYGFAFRGKEVLIGQAQT